MQRNHANARTRLLALAGCLTLSVAAACTPPQEEQETMTMSGSDATLSGSDALAAIDGFIEQAGIDKSNARWKTSLPQPPKAEFAAGTDYFWNLETNVGNLKVKLWPDTAPMHVTSTIYLTRLGFYDGTAFHRVITDFMAQGGDPLGNGTGGPGYDYDGEFDGGKRHDRPGLLSMANRGPGTDGSQFFLTFVPTPWLDGKHTLFGEVVEGEDTLKALEARGSQSGRTSEPLEIVKATISTE